MNQSNCQIRPASITKFSFTALCRTATALGAILALHACGGGADESDVQAPETQNSIAVRATNLPAVPGVPPSAKPDVDGAIGNFFVPYAMADIEAAETPISLASLNDHVAGAKGQIRNMGGHLYVGSERIRLYGVNFVLGATMPSKGDAAKIAARLRKEGFNAVRLHAWDNPLAVPNTWTVTYKPQGMLNADQTLNATALDHFDYFVDQLYKAGIYIMVTLHNGRVYKEAPDCIEACQGLDTYLPELIQSQKDLTAALLNHVNPYTGRAYKSDPGVYALEINNENSLVHRYADRTIDKYLTNSALYPKYGAPLESKWRAWAQNKYGTAAAAAAAWGKPLASFADLKAPLRADTSTPTPLYRDWYEFHSGIDATYTKDLVDYIKNTIGATSLVMGTQAHYQSMLSRNASEISDFHSYFGPKAVSQGFNHSNGRPVLKVDNLSVLAYAEPKDAGFFGVHEYKDITKPSMISEFVTRMGSQYVAEAEPLVGAYAGFQDIDAIFLMDAQQMNDRTTKNYYSGLANVSVSSVSRVAAALSFRRGDVTPGEPYVLRKTRDSILNVAASSRNHNPPNVAFGGGQLAPLTRNMYQEVVDSPVDETVVRGGEPVDGKYTTTTGQMVWKPKDRITVDSPLTKTAIGFFRNTAVDLGSGISVTVGKTMNNYATIQMTSLVKGAALPSSKMLLALTGYFTVPGEYPREPGGKLFSWGDDYPRIEAVPSTVRIATVNKLKVSALDSTGAKRFDVPVVSGSGYAEFVTGPAYDTGWYLIESIGNAVPTATLTAPSEVVKGTAVALSATASDGDGSVAKVEFYDGSTLIGTDTTAPYGITWTPSVTGARSLTAKATDNLGASTVSSPVVVTVYASNTAPTASWLVLPATGRVGVQTYLSASATDADGRVVKVEFYDGDRLIDTDTTAPYSTLWTPPTAGAHRMTVRVTDNLGAVTVSAPKTTNVSN